MPHEKVRLLRQKAQGLVQGFVPESDVQLCEFFGAFELGVAWYEQLTHPTAADERWVALCLLATGQRERALEHLWRAVALGERAAHIDLARVLVVLNRMSEGRAELEKVSADDFDGYNRALYHRNGYYLNLVGQNMEEAFRCITLAWKEVQLVPEFPFLASKILLNLADAHGYRGDRSRNLYYLERAEALCCSELIWSIKMSKVQLMYIEGRHDEVLEEVDVIFTGTRTSHLKIYAVFMRGQVSLSRNDLKGALEHLHACHQMAVTDRHNHFEFYALSSLVMVYQRLGDPTTARVHLQKLSKVRLTQVNQNTYNLRRLYVEWQQLPFEQVLSEMLAMWESRRGGDAMEFIRCSMHLCEMLLQQDHPLAPGHISLLVDRLIAYDSRWICSEEWVFLDALPQHFRKHHPALVPDTTGDQVTLLTIDREDLLLNGQVQHLPFRKSMELIVYLLHRQHATLNQIISEVFADTPPERARNYFHQLRHVLNQKIQILSIDFDRTSRRYHLSSQARLEWDLQAVLDGRRSLRGVFLPSSGSEWVLELNQQCAEELEPTSGSLA